MKRLQGSMLLVLLALGSLAAANPSQAARRCVEAACFDAAAAIGETSGTLRGAGLLEYMVWDVYAAALYTANDSAPLPKRPQRLVLHYLREIDGDDIRLSTREALKKNTTIDAEALRERIDRVCALYPDVKAGDRYEIVFVPGAGTTLIFNGAVQATIEGDDFAEAFLGIWLSDRFCLDEELQQKLVGARVSDGKLVPAAP